MSRGDSLTNILQTRMGYDNEINTVISQIGINKFSEIQ